jgi:hypothetical protein
LVEHLLLDRRCRRNRREARLGRRRRLAGSDRLRRRNGHAVLEGKGVRLGRRHEASIRVFNRLDLERDEVLFLTIGTIPARRRRDRSGLEGKGGLTTRIEPGIPDISATHLPATRLAATGLAATGLLGSGNALNAPIRLLRKNGPGSRRGESEHPTNEQGLRPPRDNRLRRQGTEEPVVPANRTLRMKAQTTVITGLNKVSTKRRQNWSPF